MSASSLKNYMAISALFLALVCTTAVGRTIYVDDDASLGSNGQTWSTAYKYLQDALADARSDPNVNEIRVAQGVYKPDQSSAHPYGSGDRTAKFQLVNGVAIKGGYAGFGESDPNARDIETYESVLSGDLNGDDYGDLRNWIDNNWPFRRTENSLHIVSGGGAKPSTLLDGLTLKGGFADGSDINSFDQGLGGGLYAYMGTLTDCIVTQNFAYFRGGGLSNCTLTIVGCKITQNYTEHYGGGMSNCNVNISNSKISGNLCDNMGGGGFQCSGSIRDSIISQNGNRYGWGYGGGLYSFAGTIENSTIINNWTHRGHGGGIQNLHGSIKNCVIAFNTVGDWGGGIAGTSGDIINCVIAYNSANKGGGLYHWGGPITNCIFWGNTATQGHEIYLSGGGVPSSITISYTDLEGGEQGVFIESSCTLIWGGGNIDADPCFVDPINENYHLLPGSPCIDAGDPSYVPEPNETDLDGNPRIVNGIVDMGAFEAQLLDPAELLLDLAQDIIKLNLQQGIESSLDTKLDAALQALEDINQNNDVAAINTLEAFINAVEARRGNKISEEDTDALIAKALQIIDLLSAE